MQAIEILTVVPGVSISLETRKGEVHVFHLGEKAYYSGYNFKYAGVVTKITARNVFIQDGRKGHRLDLARFAFWNRESESGFSAWSACE